jgi:hypothetical protein
MQLSLSRLNHWLPRGQAHPEVVQGTAEGPHPSAAAHLPEAASVFDATTALDTATDMVDPQPTLVELLVRHVLLPREFLPQIEINSNYPQPAGTRPTVCPSHNSTRLLSYQSLPTSSEWWRGHGQEAKRG